MKLLSRNLTLFLAGIVLFTSINLPSAEAADITSSQLRNDTLGFADALSQKYSVKVNVEENMMLDDSALEALKSIDSAFQLYSTDFIKEVVSIYKQNGKSTQLSIRAPRESDVPGGVGSFSRGKNYVDLSFIGFGAFSTEDITHEVGHFVNYAIDLKYGETKFKNGWEALNVGYQYGSSWDENASHVFVCSYAQSSYREDVACLFSYLITYPDKTFDKMARPEGSALKAKTEYLKGVLLACFNNSSQISFYKQEYRMDIPDEWAKPEVDKAISLRLVPEGKQELYRQNITRNDFCTLVIRLISRKSNKAIEDIMKQKGLDKIKVSYKDSVWRDDSINAYKLGIVKGRDTGYFDGEGYITRQEAAVMLTNTAKVLGVNTSINDVNMLTFSDNAAIASWAKDSVGFVYKCGIMNGVGNNAFAPNENYTRQQAYLTMLRLYEK